jgi:hypothetical protein
MRKACASIEERLIRAEEALRDIIDSAEALDRILPTASGNEILRKFRASICGAKSCLVSPNAKLRDAALAQPRPHPTSEGKDLTP